MAINLRLAKLEDAQEILDIYSPYIEHTNITFEYEVPSLIEFQKRMAIIMNKYPFIVAVENDIIIGYAYAHEHMERAAYQWNVETSIYISDKNLHRGVGSLLYGRLIDILKLQNVKNVYACVTLPNDNSEKIHNAFGFQLVGRFHKSGYKFGTWHDVGWFELHISDHQELVELKEIIPIDCIADKVLRILEII